MRTNTAVVALATLMLSLPLHADEPELFCGTSAQIDRLAESLEARGRVRDRERLAHRLESDAGPTVPVERAGFFVIEADDSIAPGGRKFDLLSRSIRFEPRGTAKFAATNIASRYVAPTGEPLHTFVKNSDADWYYRRVPLTKFTFPIFGRQIDALYLTAYNGIHFSPPAEPTGEQFDQLDAVTTREPMLSPLAIARKPARYLDQPSIFVQESVDKIVITWHAGGQVFGYDIQAELHANGEVVYSYYALRSMDWGMPVISQGYDVWAPTEQLLSGSDDPADVSSTAPPAIAGMIDIRRVELVRVGDSDLLMIRIRVAEPIDRSKFPDGRSLEYSAAISGPGTTSFFAALAVEVKRDGSTLVTPILGNAIANRPSARANGDTIELFFTQSSLPFAGGGVGISAFAETLSTIANTPIGDVDSAQTSGILARPNRLFVADLSAATQPTELEAPLTEPFLLPSLSVETVWNRLKATFPVTDADVDGVAVFQSFFTDIIFYAGAYATGSNPQADGIRPASRTTGTRAPKRTTVMHMNRINYNYTTAEKSTSQLVLHEFGHRWLYQTRIREDGATTNVLNPVSSHPAQYVHTPAAFNVFTNNDSSVMGGAVFGDNGDGSWTARVSNSGYTWNELYLMGLAAPEEVPSWFYLRDTSPRLGNEYWPADNTTVSGQRRDVAISQLTDALGQRSPTASTSQKLFKVLFVLVIEPGAEPTHEQLSRINLYRGIFERDFSKATGGRAAVVTKYSGTNRQRVTRR